MEQQGTTPCAAESRELIGSYLDGRVEKCGDQSEQTDSQGGVAPTRRTFGHQFRNPDGQAGQPQDGDQRPEQSRVADDRCLIVALGQEGQQHHHGESGATAGDQSPGHLRDVYGVEQGELVPVDVGGEDGADAEGEDEHQRGGDPATGRSAMAVDLRFRQAHGPSSIGRKNPKLERVMERTVACGD